MPSFQHVFLLFSFLALLFCAQLLKVSDVLEVTFLDIGQGDSILIDTPHGRKVLIDGGPKNTLMERLGEELSFWDSGFEMIVLSHPDLDHLEGLVDVMDRFEVERVLITGVYHSSALYKHFQEQVANSPAEIILAKAGQVWELDEEVFLETMYPLRSPLFQEADNLNDTSIAFRLLYRDFSMMLSGDLEEDAEHELLLSGQDLRSQVFKAGHHGSRTSNTPDFLRAVDPEFVVIQAGVDNPFDHPHVDIVMRFDEAGVPWVSTQEYGSISIFSDGMTWWPEEGIRY